MADDARISTAFPRHPKTVKLQRRLGATGCGSLVCLFLWVADNRPDGDLSGMSDEDIEIAAGWSATQTRSSGPLSRSVSWMVKDRFNKLKEFETSGNGKPGIGQIVEREQAILRARRA